MKKFATLMLGLSLLAGATTVFAQDKMDSTNTTTSKTKKMKKHKSKKTDTTTTMDKKS